MSLMGKETCHIVETAKKLYDSFPTAIKSTNHYLSSHYM